MIETPVSLPCHRSITINPSSPVVPIPAFTPVLAGYMSFLACLPAPRRVHAGAHMIDQGYTAQAVHLLERGVVKLVHLNAEGRETTTGLRSQGWYAGSTSVILNAPSVYTVRAVTECRVIRIPATEFLNYLRKDSEMMGHFLAGLCLEVASQANLHAQIMAASAEERLDRFTRERETANQNRPTVDPLPLLKQMEVAQLLSITPEHLSRLMNKRRERSPPRETTLRQTWKRRLSPA